jgi:hypothetical protein
MSTVKMRNLVMMIPLVILFQFSRDIYRTHLFSGGAVFPTAARAGAAENADSFHAGSVLA